MSGTHSTYKGDSPGKKVARARLWLNAGMVMTALDVQYRGAYVLAGEGGDVSTLKALGFKPETITAVDLDPEYANFCGELYPGITTLAGEAGEWAGCVDYNGAHLDFCNGITLENIDTARKVILGAGTYPMCLGITMMKGREAPAKLNKHLHPNIPRKIRKDLMKAGKKFGHSAGDQLLMRGKMFDPKVCIGRARKRLLSHANGPGWYDESDNWLRSAVKNGKLTPLGTGLIRMDAFRSCLNVLLLEHGLGVVPVMALCYHSKSNHSNGTPFVCGNFIVAKLHELQVYEQYLFTYSPSLMCFEAIPGRESQSALRNFALSAAHGLPSKTVGNLFDIPPETVIAWRAHETRGTYKDIRHNRSGLRVASESGNESRRIEYDEAFKEGTERNPLWISSAGRQFGAPLDIQPMYSGWGNIVYTPEWELRLINSEEDARIEDGLHLELTAKAGK